MKFGLSFKRHDLVWPALLFLSVCFMSISARAQNYSVTAIEALPGTNAIEGRAVNDLGQVVLQSDGVGFLWDDGAITVMSELNDFGTPTVVNDINNQGMVVGDSSLGPVGFQRATLWTTDNEIIDIGQLAPYYSSSASALNENGQVVGNLFGAFGQPYGFMWSKIDGMVHPELEVSDNSTAHDINETGEVVGSIYASTSDNYWRAYHWKPGGWLTLFGSPSFNTHAMAINNVGQIVGGTAEMGQEVQAFLYENGEMTPIGPIEGHESSTALDINDAGTVVGVSDLLGQAGSRAFVYRNGEALDLNTLIPGDSGWELLSANGINELGEIVGHGKRDGEKKAFLLTPCFEYADVDEDGDVSLADVQLVVEAFQDNFEHITFDQADIAPCGGNGLLNFDDIFAAVLAFKGSPPCAANCS